MDKNELRSLGSIYTPPDFAQLLTSWGVQDRRQKVLDVGVGEGAFTFAAYHRLIRLGARASAAQRQIYGAEIYRPTYERFNSLATQLNLIFPNVHCGDFFDFEFPQVDVVLGNPPYVRRTLIQNVENIRTSVLGNNKRVDEDEVSRLSDLYIYFLLQASSHLKEGGRLAVITADSWLNARYGVAFKKFLQENFKIESLISLDRQVFDAEVKPVLTLATKKMPSKTARQVRFIRVKNGLPVSNLLQVVNKIGGTKPDVVISTVKSQALDISDPWGLHFKAPNICEEMASHDLMTPMCNVAQTSIGIQTLAKEFFVLTKEQVQTHQIEQEYLTPLAPSSRYYNAPTIEPGTPPIFYLFYCSKGKEELCNTPTLRYIELGEAATVPVRGKNVTVVGYHNKDRIRQDKRTLWYDLRSKLERRGRATILIPRLIYRTFQVVWNKAGFVPGELFIEFMPSLEPKIEDEVYLAVLSSSLTELMLRAHSQLYGGGMYNISPGYIGDIPILNVKLLSGQERRALKDAYLTYVAHTDHDRSVIDSALYDALGLSRVKRRIVVRALSDLVALATSSAKAGRVRP